MVSNDNYELKRYTRLRSIVFSLGKTLRTIQIFTYFGQKMLWFKEILGPKEFLVKIIFVKKNFETKLWSENFETKFGLKKIWMKMF